MKHNFGLLSLLTAALVAAGSICAMAAGPGEAKKEVAESTLTESSFQSVDAAVNRIITVCADPETVSYAQVLYYEKDESGNWTTVFDVPAYIGRNGMTDDKHEGDGMTPTGAYGFTMAFGVNPDPGSRMPYHLVDPFDYWVDDSSSVHYNTLVNSVTTACDWTTAEHMISVLPQYYYGLALNYNPECTPNRGSAIFLHCYHSSKKYSSGCIAIPQENMIQVLKDADASTRIVIAKNQTQLKELLSQLK